MEPETQEKRGFFSKIPRKVKWLIIALIFNNIAIGYLLVYLTAFFPELNISAGVVGLLLGLEGAMVLLSIPLGILSDRRGRKKLLLIGTSLVPLPIIMIALTVNVAILVIAAIILGVAESAALSTWNAIIADQTQPNETDQRQEFPNSDQVLRDKQPHRTWCRIHHTSNSDVAFPQVRNPGHV